MTCSPRGPAAEPKCNNGPVRQRSDHLFSFGSPKPLPAFFVGFYNDFYADAAGTQIIASSGDRLRELRNVTTGSRASPGRRPETGRGMEQNAGTQAAGANRTAARECGRA